MQSPAQSPYTAAKLRAYSSGGSQTKRGNPDLAIRCGLAVAFTFSLLVAYEIEISARWAYYGFVPIDNLFYSALVVLLAAIATALVPMKSNSRSFLLTSLIYIFFIPSFVISVANRDGVHLGTTLLSFCLIFVISSLVVRPIRLPPMRPSNFLYLCIALGVMLVFSLLATGASKEFNLNLLLIYDLRAEATANMPPILAYTFSGVSKVVIPAAVVFAIGLGNRKWLLMAGLLALTTFAITYHKSVFAIPLAAGAMYYIQKDRADNMLLHALFVGVILLTIVDILLLIYFDGSGFFSSFIARRVFMTPPLIDSFYLDFFANAEKYYWSTSAVGFGFAENPYPLTAPHLIGQQYFGTSANSANTGVIGSGFAHAGLFGVALYSSLLGFLICVLNSYGRVLGHTAVSCIALPIVITIANTSDFSTAFLTHGLAMMLLILVVFPRERVRGGNIGRSSI